MGTSRGIHRIRASPWIQTTALFLGLSIIPHRVLRKPAINRMNFIPQGPLDAQETEEISLDNGINFGEITERYHRTNSAQRPMFTKDTTPFRLLYAGRRGIRRFFLLLHPQHTAEKRSTAVRFVLPHFGLGYWNHLGPILDDMLHGMLLECVPDQWTTPSLLHTPLPPTTT